MALLFPMQHRVPTLSFRRPTDIGSVFRRRDKHRRFCHQRERDADAQHCTRLCVAASISHGHPQRLRVTLHRSCGHHTLQLSMASQWRRHFGSNSHQLFHRKRANQQRRLLLRCGHKYCRHRHQRDAVRPSLTSCLQSRHIQRRKQWFAAILSPLVSPRGMTPLSYFWQFNGEADSRRDHFCLHNYFTTSIRCRLYTRRHRHQRCWVLLSSTATLMSGDLRSASQP